MEYFRGAAVKGSTNYVETTLHIAPFVQSNIKESKKHTPQLCVQRYTAEQHRNTEVKIRTRIDPMTKYTENIGNYPLPHRHTLHNTPFTIHYKIY